MRSRIALVLLVALAALPAAGEDPGPAAAPIQRLYDAILATMKQADELGYRGRFEQLEPVITQVYDLPFMSEKVLGRSFRKLSQDEQRRWVDTFTRHTVSTYAQRFGPFAGERFEVLSSEPASGDTVLVRTHIVPPDDAPVEVDYRMRRDGERWEVVDVYLNGTVSELALRRSEYATVLRRDGFESLVRSLEEKIESPETKEGASSS